MLQRRAGQAGYESAVHPHMLRHTFASDWLSNGDSEGDLMRLAGWRTRLAAPPPTRCKDYFSRNFATSLP